MLTESKGFESVEYVAFCCIHIDVSFYRTVCVEERYYITGIHFSETARPPPPITL